MYGQSKLYILGERQLQVLDMGELTLHITNRGKHPPMKTALKDIVILREGGEFVDSSTKKSYLRFEKGRTNDSIGISERAFKPYAVRAEQSQPSGINTCFFRM